MPLVTKPGGVEKIADVITIPESTTREQFLREVKTHKISSPKYKSLLEQQGV